MNQAAIVFVAIMTAACTQAERPAPESPYCDEQATVIPAAIASDLGISGDNVLALAEGVHTSSLVWNRAGVDATDLTLTVQAGAEVRSIVSEAVYPEGDGQVSAIGIVCDDRLEVDASFLLQTTERELDEAWDGFLVARVADAASFSQDLDPDALTGTYDMDRDITVPAYDARELWVEGRFDVTGSRGSLRGQVSGESDCDGDTCASWAEEIVVAEWGGPEA